MITTEKSLVKLRNKLNVQSDHNLELRSPGSADNTRDWEFYSIDVSRYSWDIHTRTVEHRTK